MIANDSAVLVHEIANETENFKNGSGFHKEVEEFAGMSEYELERLNRIQRNQQIMQNMGIDVLGSAINGMNKKKKRPSSRKRRDFRTTSTKILRRSTRRTTKQNGNEGVDREQNKLLAKIQKEEEEEEEEETYDVDADVQALLEGEELSEEFQNKARTIFETAIKSKVADIKEELNESYANALVEELDTIKTGLTERVDSYLEYVADEWLLKWVVKQDLLLV